MEAPTLDLDRTKDIERIFEREFWPIAGLFDRLIMDYEEAEDSDDPRVARPGVYVWLSGDEVLKVGRSFSDARKRALEHIRDNTAQKMGVLAGDPEARLVLFTVLSEDYHWVAALEVFLENNLQPSIPSKRQG